VRVGVGAGVRLDAAADPLGRCAQPIEVGVAADGVDGAGALDQFRCHHLRAGAVLRLGAQHEARIVRVQRVLLVIVVVDPHRQPLTETVDEGLGGALEAHAPRALSSEGHIQNDDAPLQAGRFR
jgi:hypothetical protein